MPERAPSIRIFWMGVVKGAEGDSTIKILNPQRLLRDEFARTRRLRSARRDRRLDSGRASARSCRTAAAGVVGQLRPRGAGIRPPARPRAGDHSAAGACVGGSAFRDGRAGRGDAARPSAAAGVVARAAGIAERCSSRGARQGRGSVDGERRRRHGCGPHPRNHPHRSRLDRPGARPAHARGRGRGDHVDLSSRPWQAPGCRAFARPPVPLRSGAPRPFGAGQWER